LLPQPHNIPKIFELYIFDTKNEIKKRIRALKKQDEEATNSDPYVVEEL
jgi:hypothetical protein